MLIEFEYEADVSWMTNEERQKFAKELKECTCSNNWANFEMTRNQLNCCGSYDNEDGDLTDHEDIETVLNRYDVECFGGATEVEYEPDWDAMPGGVDDY